MNGSHILAFVLGFGLALGLVSWTGRATRKLARYLARENVQLRHDLDRLSEELAEADHKNNERAAIAIAAARISNHNEEEGIER